MTWHGRTVHTAVWKHPVAGAQMVRRLNIDGDGQGDLGACDAPVRCGGDAAPGWVCHSCETALLSGTVSDAPDPVDDPADRSALICCARPRGDLILDL